MAVLAATVAMLAAACIPPTEPVTPEVVVTAPSPTVTYGDTIPALEATYGANVPTVLATCSTTATDGSSVGTYPVTCSGAQRSGHTIRYVAGTLTIAPASATVTASGGSLDFGGSVPAITATYDGLVGISEPAVLASCSTAATSTSPAGSYASTCSGASDPNHTFTYVDGTVTVGSVPVVVTASSATTTYGDDAPEIQATYSGLVNGDTAPATPAECVTDATASSGVGSYASSCSGAADPSYTFTYVDGTVTVDPAAAVVTASSASVAFGDAIPAVTASYSGLVNGDVAPATAPTCSTTATQGAAIGSYPTTCVGAADPNYTFTSVDGSISIVAGTAPVTLTASSATITYGDDAPEITASYSGFTGGQTAPETEPVCSTTATSSSPVGTYPTTCVGAADPNHVFTVVNGTVTVTPAAATVTASSESSAYGAPLAAVTASYSGLLNGDVAPATAPVCSTTATTASDAGSYTTSCAGAADPNYTFDTVDGAYTVTPAAATVTASSASSVYGAAVAAVTASYAGLVNGDVAPATAPTCSTTATSASGVGSYATTCAGAGDPNYTFTSVDGAHDVTPAPATVTASSATITEGDDAPEITASYSGLVNGDTAPATAPTCSTTATSSSAAGTYPSTCVGAADPNYTFTAVDGTVTVEAVNGPEPEIEYFGLASYAPSIATTTLNTSGSVNLPQSTINVASGSGAGFPGWVNLTVESTNGPQQLFCNTVGATSFGTCTGGTGTLVPGGHVSNVSINQFDVYTLVGGAATVEPSSLTIIEDVPAAARGMASRVTANATHGLITYVQGAGATGDFNLTFGICDAGTSTYSASDPSCSLGQITYGAPAVARLAQRISVLFTNQDIYNNFPVAVRAPSNVAQGERFTMKWAGTAGAMPTRQSAPIINQVTVNYGSTFSSIIPVPAGLTYVPSSARLVGGDARMSGVATVQYCTTTGGSCDASTTGNWDGTTLPYLKVTVPTNVSVPGGVQFTMPTLEADFTATGASGSTSNFRLTQYKNVTNTSSATVTFNGYPSESASGNPAKATPRTLRSVVID